VNNVCSMSPLGACCDLHFVTPNFSTARLPAWPPSLFPTPGSALCQVYTRPSNSSHHFSGELLLQNGIPSGRLSLGHCSMRGRLVQLLAHVRHSAGTRESNAADLRLCSSAPWALAQLRQAATNASGGSAGNQQQHAAAAPGAQKGTPKQQQQQKQPGKKQAAAASKAAAKKPAGKAAAQQAKPDATASAAANR
jgi:hypothetical protein